MRICGLRRELGFRFFRELSYSGSESFLCATGYMKGVRWSICQDYDTPVIRFYKRDGSTETYWEFGDNDYEPAINPNGKKWFAAELYEEFIKAKI